MIGWKGYQYDPEVGDEIWDKDGRWGKIVTDVWDSTLNETVFTVDPGYGVLIEIRQTLVSYICKAKAE